MDPNATLRQIRGTIEQARVGNNPDAHHLADLIEALDEWLTHGGFLPDAWYQHGPADDDGILIDEQHRSPDVLP